MEVHADVLRMAASKEKRDRIKWNHACTVFFGASVTDGLELAHLSDCEDARFFVSLFRDEKGPLTRERARECFLAHPDDPRTLCWAAELESGPLRAAWLGQAAEGGYARAQTLYAVRNGADESESRMWLEKAVAQEDSEGMLVLAMRLTESSNFRDVQRVYQLLRSAAELGNCAAQYQFSQYCCATDTLEQVLWLRRAAIQHLLSLHRKAIMRLCVLARSAVPLFDKGGSGRITYEIGQGLAQLVTQWKREIFDNEMRLQCERALALYLSWHNEASEAVVLWLRLSRTHGVAKDIRLLVAHDIWSHRLIWGDARPRQVVPIAEPAAPAPRAAELSVVGPAREPQPAKTAEGCCVM